jgi:hypothetical protein
MIKNLVFPLLFSLALVTAAHAALPASDKANDPAYTGGTWTTATNGGTGFGAWSFGATGAGNHFIGLTGEGENPSFGVFAGGAAGNGSNADRQFTGALSDGQTFSMDIGNTANVTTGGVGVIGLNLLDGTNVVFTIKFTGGGTSWAQNNGGSDFGIGQAFAANTPLHFSFTLVSGATKTYNYTFGSASGTNFVGSVGNYTNITGVRVFSNAQGVNENVGINNLAIVPEPGTLSLLAGPAILGAWFFIRRRRG